METLPDKLSEYLLRIRLDLNPSPFKFRRRAAKSAGIEMQQQHSGKVDTKRVVWQPSSSLESQNSRFISKRFACDSAGGVLGTYSAGTLNLSFCPVP